MTSEALRHHGSERIDPHLAYLVDGPVSMAMGVVLILASGPLTDLAGWSVPPYVLLVTGILLLPWGAFNLVTGRRVRPPAAVVRTIVAIDGAWLLGSLVLLWLFRGELSAWGVGLILVQAIAVSAIFAAKVVGARALAG